MWPQDQKITDNAPALLNQTQRKAKRKQIKKSKLYVTQDWQSRNQKVSIFRQRVRGEPRCRELGCSSGRNLLHAELQNIAMTARWEPKATKQSSENSDQPKQNSPLDRMQRVTVKPSVSKIKSAHSQLWVGRPSQLPLSWDTSDTASGGEGQPSRLAETARAPTMNNRLRHLRPTTLHLRSKTYSQM